ncbi:hypothetical protein PFISCL1PPCAC_1512, partial [Pristionchus fissidentatus]
VFFVACSFSLFTMLGRARSALGEHNFFGLRWIIEKFNDLDVERIREVGAERACAEWVLRCGGSVRFDDGRPEVSDYNQLVEQTAQKSGTLNEKFFFLNQVRAVNACVTARGCRHFEGVTRLQDVVFSGCKNLEDDAINVMVQNVGSTLRSVEFSNCRYITQDGLRHLGKCSSLSSVILTDLPRVKEWEKLKEELKSNLPKNCEVACYPSKK